MDSLPTLTILCDYLGIHARGAETFVHHLANQLVALGFSVFVHQQGEALRGATYQVKLTHSPISPQTDILFPTNGRTQALQAKLWCLAHHKKLIISGQSGPGLDDRCNLWLFPDLFVALTTPQASWARQVNPWVSVITIPNGVDLTQFNPKVAPLALSLAKPIILFVGEYAPSKPTEISKRPDLLRAAAAKINCSVLCVGRGGDLQLPNDQMPAVYTACNLFSYPTSPQESFGIALLEAMASGLPVVTTDDPIRREIVGDAGLFVDPADTAAYAQALHQALNRSWDNKPRHRAEHFSWVHIASRYSQALLSLTHA